LAMYSFIAFTISRARSTARYETCVFRRKDTTSRPTAWTRYSATSVAAGPPLPISVRLRISLGGMWAM
jgi:hypothetical protein